MTQAELAERVGLGRTSVTNLERGKQNPPLSLLPKLAQALGVSPSELLTEVGTPAEISDSHEFFDQVPDPQLRRWASRLIAESPIGRTAPERRNLR